ncbi:MAG: HD domain-containing protein, partial [Gammaproteobacteria bacterium]
MSIIKNRVLISDLCKVLDKYLSKDDVADVYKAYIVAASAHDGQYRKSGEAYVFHPINVAMILADLGFDRDSIIAALLHDCIEDTEITYEEIQKDFGQDVAFIVEGVSKLTDLQFKSKKDQQAQNFRKLLLAMSNDMRVIIIKLADRLHNMRTISSMTREKQIAISQETIDIHAPIARRLGLNSIKIELENIAFETLNPHRSKVIKQHLKKQFGNFKKNISHVQSEIIQRLSDEGVSGALVEGRQKEPYSLYRKMRYKHLKLSEVFDLFAFRVIVKDVAECYRTLGIIHNLYKPLPGKFKDYIALPKANGYQSLHTVLFGPKKMFIEIQIRSKDMHFISEYGIAAHWHYKNSNKEQTATASNWLGSLLDIQEASGTSVDFI